MSFTSIIRYLVLVVGSIGALVLGEPTIGQSAYDGFNPPALNNGIATNVAMQTDGKVLIAGYFQLGNNNIARLFSDGSHDTTFSAQEFSFSDRVLDLAVRSDGAVLVAGDRSGSNDGVVALLNSDGSSVFHRLGMANRAVHSIIEQPGGKFLIAGEFTSVDGQPRPRIARLKADGSLDESYDPSAGADAAITQLLPQPDGKVVVAGEFTTIGDQPRARIARLNADGSLDTGFNLQTGTNDSIAALALQPDGKVLIAGAFTAVGHSARNRIARLNADGSVDETFRPASGPDAAVNDIVLLPDGGLVIAGNFLSVDGEPRNRIARLHPDGRLDDRFPPNSTATRDVPHTAGVNSPILGLAMQQDGKVVLVGSFNEVDGKPRSGIARLNADGSLDADLEIGPGMVILGRNGGGSASGSITATTIQPDGKYLIGGQFDESYGVPRKGIVRFNANGTLDLSFDPGAGASYPHGGDEVFYIHGVALQSDLKVLVGGAFLLFDDVPSPGLVRLHSNGARDAGFAPALHPSDGAFAQVTHIVPLAAGKTLIGGWIQSEADGGHRKLLRLLPDGSIDPGFIPYDFPATNPWTSYVTALAVQTDGRILLGYEAGDGDGIHLRTMIRLLADGSLDPSFAELMLDLNVNVEGIDRILPQPDGKILLTGGFVELRGQRQISIARLNPEDGSLDAAFVSDVTAPDDHPYIADAALQSDGSILIGGSPEYIIDSATTGKVARLFNDGLLDHRFDFNPPAGPFAAGGAGRLAIDASGKMLMGGSFHWMYPGTQCCDSVARIQTRQPALQSLSLGGDQARVEWRRSGVGPEFTRTSFEGSTDGVRWELLDAGVPMLCEGDDCGAWHPAVSHVAGHSSAARSGYANLQNSTRGPTSPSAGGELALDGRAAAVSSAPTMKANRGGQGIAKVIISQVYGGSTTSTPIRRDFIELFNAGDAPQELNGWSVQYALAGLDNWQATPLPDVTLQPGQYYLIQERGTGSDVGALPTPDAIGNIDMGTNTGKVALVRSVMLLTGTCPTAPVVASFVGYGTGANCYEGAATGQLSSALAAVRGNGGCADGYNNQADFALVAPTPRNSASMLNVCSSNGAQAAITAVEGASQSAPANLPFAMALKIRVTDTVGNPVPAAAVSFDAPDAGASAALSPGMARTNAQGEAVVVATAGSTIGNYVVTARVAGVAAVASFALSNVVEGSPASIVATGGTPQDVTVNQPFAAPLAVRVVDVFGTPVANASIRFDSPATGARALLASANALTDGNGEASVIARANRTTGSYVVTATVAGLAPVDFQLTNTQGPDEKIVVSQVFVSGAAYDNRFIELFNAGGAPQDLTGWSVQYARADQQSWTVTALTGLTLQPGQYYLIQQTSNGSGGAPLPTPDAIGSVTMLDVAGKLALVRSATALTGMCPSDDASVIDFVGYGTFTSCAEYAPIAVSTLANQAALRSGSGCTDTGDNGADFLIGVPMPRNTSSPIHPCSTGSLEVFGGTPQNTAVYRPFPMPLAVRVVDALGDPLSGQTVNFNVPGGGASAALSTSSAVTDAGGVGSVVAVANGIAGSYVVTASVSGINGSVSFELANTEASLVAASGTPQRTVVDQAFAEPLVVKLTGSDGSPIPDIEVSFVAPSGGASAVLSSATATTNSNGVASVTATANDVAGEYEVVANVAGASAPATFVLTQDNLPTGPWRGWGIAGLNLPRNRNVWIRARGFTVDGSLHESVKVFYLTGGFTATPVAGEGGRIEPSIPQGGEAGEVLSFTIVPDAGYGVASVSGCGGSLNGATYLTAPLSADCEVVASFGNGVITHTVTSSAGSGGAIEPSGLQTVTEGETISFVLLPDAGQQTAAVTGTCGGELVDDVFTTIPVMADCSVLATFEPELIGDSIFDNGFEPETSER